MRQANLSVIRTRARLVRARTSLINTARGLTKSCGERLRGCSPRNIPHRFRQRETSQQKSHHSVPPDWEYLLRCVTSAMRIRKEVRIWQIRTTWLL